MSTVWLCLCRSSIFVSQSEIRFVFFFYIISFFKTHVSSLLLPTFFAKKISVVFSPFFLLFSERNVFVEILFQRIPSNYLIQNAIINVPEIQSNFVVDTLRSMYLRLELSVRSFKSNQIILHFIELFNFCSLQNLFHRLLHWA